MEELNHHGDLFTQLIVEIFRLNGLILEAGDRIAEPVGLTSARWQVLGIVEHEPIPVAHVARYMGLSRQTIQQTADGLAREGFITYRENPHHRRAKLMQITKKGEDALEYVREQQAAWAERVSSEQSIVGLQQAVELLRGLRRNLDDDNARFTTRRSIRDETESPESNRDRPDGDT